MTSLGHAIVRPFVWAVRVVLIGATFLYFGVGSLVLSYALLPFALRRLPAGPARVRRAHEIVARGFHQFHAIMRVLRLIRYDPREIALALPEGACVVVANHPTLVDVTAITAVMGSVCTVVKQELCDNIFVGGILRESWHIAGGDVASMAGAAVIQGALDRLAAGFPVLVFPEGTRSPPGGLRRFRRGAFEMACRANVPVVVLFVSCTPPTLMKGVPWYAIPKRLAHMNIERLDVLRPEDFGGDAKKLTAHVQATMRARLDAWLAEHPEDAPPATTSGDGAPDDGAQA